MKHTRLLDAVVVAAMLLANIPELTDSILPEAPAAALIEPAETPEDNAERQS